MGYRDDELIDAQADTQLRQLLDTPETIEPSPDLVARTLSRLPPEPPARAAQHIQKRRHQRVLMASIVGVVILGIAALNLWSTVGHGPELAFAFGNGRTGMSSVLLGLHLAAKPLWNSLRGLHATLLIGGLALAALSVAALRGVVRRTHAPNDTED